MVSPPYSATIQRALWPLSGRFKRDSVGLTSNLPFGQWNEIFAGDVGRSQPARLVASCITRMSSRSRGTAAGSERHQARIAHSVSRAKSTYSRLPLTEPRTESSFMEFCCFRWVTKTSYCNSSDMEYL